MTDNEIIKALGCCSKDDCDNCPNTFGNCYANLAGYALALINRQKAEIKRLKEDNKILTINADNAFQDGLDEAKDLYSHEIKAEAVKEFAKRLHKDIDDFREKREMVMLPYTEGALLYVERKIDNLVKETVGIKE